MSGRDAWYGAGGAPNRRPGGPFLDPNGGRGRDLGVFHPGGFVRSFNGAATRDGVFGYAQYAFRF